MRNRTAQSQEQSPGAARSLKRLHYEGRRAASARAAWDMTETAEYLREQARRCRRLAKSVITADVVKTLTGMADEYETRADRLEAEAREGKA